MGVSAEELLALDAEVKRPAESAGEISGLPSLPELQPVDVVTRTAATVVGTRIVSNVSGVACEGVALAADAAAVQTERLKRHVWSVRFPCILPPHLYFALYRSADGINVTSSAATMVLFASITRSSTVSAPLNGRRAKYTRLVYRRVGTLVPRRPG
jgi:hypothetical protein